MHLSYKTSKYKEKVYISYSIAESYREGNTVKKRTIWPLGKLTDLQAEQIRNICKIVSDPDKIVTALDDIVVQESKTFGEIAVADALWREWKLSKAFQNNQTSSKLSTALIARILTLNRCVDPCSNYSIPKWVEKTAVSEVVNHPLAHLNDDKIYHELDKIDWNHESLEDHLFHMTYHRQRESYKQINYDLTSSYFVGNKCSLSNYGKSKDNRPYNKQVLLGIMVTKRGYPFKWDVYPGNMPEVDTLVNNIDACIERFRLTSITIVFDRGIVSEDNLDYIDGKGLRYISGLNKDQIPSIGAIDLSVFIDLSVDNYKAHLLGHGFQQYDDLLFYKDLGIVKDRRYIIGFNPVLFQEERDCRDGKIAHFERFLIYRNEELKNAKRSRKRDSTRQSILNELKRLKIRKYYYKPELKEIIIERERKDGSGGTVRSFEVTVKKKDDIIALSKKLDGVCVFVSNHTEVSDNVFCFSAEDIILAYREKTKIEDAFKHIKSFLKLRPFYVNTDAHVRASYSINILAYFINKDLAERRKRIEGIDFLNSKHLYEPFKEYKHTTIMDKVSEETKSEPMRSSPKIEKYISQLKLNIM